MKEQFQHKLYHFQAEPPAETWDKIASSLDSDPNSLFPQKLYNYTAQPPEHIWKNIVSKIDEGLAPVIPITKRYGKVYKYGGVAAGMLAFAFLVSIFFNKTSVSTGTSSLDVLPQNDIVSSGQTEKKSIEKQIEADTGFSSPEPNSSTRHHTDKNQSKWFAKKQVLAIKPTKIADNTRINEVVPAHYPVVRADMLERYILFSQSDGYVVRLSKKLFNLFACPDNKINCRENIETVQQQVASPTIIASTDFTGMLDMLQNVK